MLTPEHVRELLEYEFESGSLLWKVARGGTARLGTLAGTVRADGYRLIGICGGRYYAHRLAWMHFYGVLPSPLLDHINGDRSDNRICNLREAPGGLNHHNLKKARSDNQSSGLLGVTFHSASNLWQASISLDGCKRHLGLHSTKEKAYAAYLKEKRAIHVGNTL
jgi:hypothetical protein